MTRDARYAVHLFTACLFVVFHISNGATDKLTKDPSDGTAGVPPWADKMLGGFKVLQTSVQKISAEQNLLEKEVKRLSQEEKVAAGLAKEVPKLQNALSRSNQMAVAVDKRAGLTKTWLSGSRHRGGTEHLKTNPACPSIATGHTTVYLSPRFWTFSYTVDVSVDDGTGTGGKTAVGVIHSQPFTFNSNMTLYNMHGQMVSSSKKWLITTIDETFIYDCEGKQTMHFTENSHRSKHNSVERYEIEDGQQNELGTTRMYYNYGGDLQIHAPNGKSLGTATAPFSVWYSDWIFTIKPEFYADGEGISADGIYPILLWLAEEDNGTWGTSPFISGIFSIILLCCGGCLLAAPAAAKLRELREAGVGSPKETDSLLGTGLTRA